LVSYLEFPPLARNVEYSPLFWPVFTLIVLLVLSVLFTLITNTAETHPQIKVLKQVKRLAKAKHM